MLYSQIFVKALYHLYNTAEKTTYVYMYIYTNFDMASIRLTIQRQGYILYISFLFSR